MSTLCVIVLTYIKPLEEVDDIIPAHVEWLGKGCADGPFLVSGCRLPRTGGVILAKYVGREMLESRLNQDPFQWLGLTRTETVPFEANMASSVLQSLSQTYPEGGMQPPSHWIDEPTEWRRDIDSLTTVIDRRIDP